MVLGFATTVQPKARHLSKLSNWPSICALLQSTGWAGLALKPENCAWMAAGCWSICAGHVPRERYLYSLCPSEYGANLHRFRFRYH